MRKKTATHEESKSIKTFFIYAGIVLILIIISLSIKTVTIIQKSKFDGQHQFVMAVANAGKVDKVISFDPGVGISVLEIEGKPVPLAAAGKVLAVPLDGKVDVPSGLPSDAGVTKLMTDITIRYNGVKTDITLYDLAQFLWLSKNLSANSTTTQTMKLPLADRTIDKTVAELFTDDEISSENISIQILNATDIPGMGSRLERVVSNMGGNVVAVSTLHKKQPKSKIEYFGEDTYTLDRLKNILPYPVAKLKKETIAHIVITIGEDSKSIDAF